MRVVEWPGFLMGTPTLHLASDEDWQPTDEDAPHAPPASSTVTDAGLPAARVRSVGEVIAQWGGDGPIVHEPTGISGLDNATGGGPVYGTRWYLAGAPDAGKTALLVQIAHEYARRGLTVGLLAVDEEPTDLVTRLAQRVGYQRLDCEIRDPPTLTAMGREIGGLPIWIYDETWTIESAATDLSRVARQRAHEDPATHPHGPRAALCIDSIQTVRCDADTRAMEAGTELGEPAAVTARVRAVRAVATGFRLIAIATSELGRAAYRSGDPEQQASVLASGKWSGAIEYSARALLGLRSVAGQPDLVDVEIAKNKHGPRDVHVYVRIDRRSQTLIETNYTPEPRPDRETRRDAKAQAQLKRDSLCAARVLIENPGVGVKDFRAKMQAKGLAGHDRADAAVEALGEAVVRGKAPRGGKPMSLDVARLPDELREALETTHG
jgi:hypothetical protein